MLDLICEFVVQTPKEKQRIIAEWDDDSSSYSSDIWNEYTTTIRIPTNAYASGNSWKCNSGYERYNNGCRSEVEDLLNTLKSAYVNNIAARVRTYWRYQGAEDDWGCNVYVQQGIDGTVEAVNIQNCNLDNSEKARAFKNSIERAVYKASPLPSAPDDAVFDREILFYFGVN